MARVTVEDCLENIDNRFALVILAAQRARQLLKGATPTVDAAKTKLQLPRFARLLPAMFGRVKSCKISSARTSTSVFRTIDSSGR